MYQGVLRVVVIFDITRKTMLVKEVLIDTTNDVESVRGIGEVNPRSECIQALQLSQQVHLDRHLWQSNALPHLEG